MQVVIHHREPTDGDREDFRKFLQPMLDPFFAVERAFAEQESASHTARDAVIPASNGRVDEMARAIVMVYSPLGDRQRLPEFTGGVNSALPVVASLAVERRAFHTLQYRHRRYPWVKG